MFRDFFFFFFFCWKGDPCLEVCVKKVTYLGGTSPYTTYTEVAPPPNSSVLENAKLLLVVEKNVIEIYYLLPSLLSVYLDLHKALKWYFNWAHAVAKNVILSR